MSVGRLDRCCGSTYSRRILSNHRHQRTTTTTPSHPHPHHHPVRRWGIQFGRDIFSADFCNLFRCHGKFLLAKEIIRRHDVLGEVIAGGSIHRVVA